MTVDLPSPSDTRNRSHLRNTLSKRHLHYGLQRHERCSFGGEQVVSPSVRSYTVTSLPVAAQSEPLGIVIKSGARAPKPVRFWAYLWATDDEDTTDQHWHQRVPAEHAA